MAAADFRGVACYNVNQDIPPPNKTDHNCFHLTILSLCHFHRSWEREVLHQRKAKNNKKRHAQQYFTNESNVPLVRENQSSSRLYFQSSEGKSGEQKFKVIRTIFMRLLNLKAVSIALTWLKARLECGQCVLEVHCIHAHLHSCRWAEEKTERRLHVLTKKIWCFALWSVGT